MKKIINLIAMLMLVGCINTPQEKISNLILGRWTGNFKDEYEMDIEFLTDSVIITYVPNYPSKKKYSITNDTLYISGYEDSRIIFDKETLNFTPLRTDTLRVDLLMFYEVTFRREEINN